MNETAGSSAHHDFPCSGCGAKLQFAPGTESLACPYCGQLQEIARSKAAIAEHDLQSALEQAKTRPPTDLVEGGSEIACESCGARIIVAGHSGECPYCASPVVVVQSSGEEDILPESVLPFGIDRRSALGSFHAWVKGLWFAPGDLAARAAADKLDGVYLPYWTFDSATRTRYSGKRGEHYEETEKKVDAGGTETEHKVRKTRWTPASGTIDHHFDDVLACASKSLPRGLVRGLEPWDLEALAPFSPSYLSGFQAERYAVGLEDGFAVAKERMEAEIASLVRKDIGGDEQQVDSSDTRYSDRTFKHILLPLWISAYRYKEKVYRFTVNPRTGKVSGERPYSAIKIILTIVAVVGAIAGVIYLATAR